MVILKLRLVYKMNDDRAPDQESKAVLLSAKCAPDVYVFGVEEK